jgi:hypothetical protein
MSDDSDAGASKTGRFLVTHAQDASAVLKDLDDSQVLTLGDGHDVTSGEVLEATLEPEPPMEVTWSVVDVDDRTRLTVERSPEPPTAHERDLGDEQAVGEVVREERAGTGEIHVLTVPPEETDAAVDDVLEDEATLVRAARMDGVVRVEVRAEEGVVAVRYLP